ncbi:MAG: MOSC N-terminal beta barrel domain-containing protein [Bacteroidota bacterium]
MKISALYVYPIKSLGGISLDHAQLSDRGLQHDRRWMLIDEQGKFLTQRTFHEMALLQVGIEDSYLTVRHKTKDLGQLSIDLHPQQGQEIQVQVWNDIMMAWLIDEKAGEWFSHALGQTVHLVYMPDQSQRFVKEKYAIDGDLNSFSDGMPYLLLGEASIADLNSRMDETLTIDRFRPNIVFEGGEPYAEDNMDEISMGSSTFVGAKPCIRCNLITIDQATAQAGKEPLATMAGYRRIDNNIYMGMNLLLKEGHEIRVGDEILVKSWREPLFA